MNQRSTLRILLGAAALVIVIGGVKAAAGIVAPTMLALALTIVFHPIRVRLERRAPAWVATTAVLLAAYLLIVLFTLAMVISLGQLASLVPTYAPEFNNYVEDVGGWLQDRGVDSGQSETMVGALDSEKLVGAVTALLSNIAGVLGNLFFLVTLLMFMALDAAYVSRITEGTRAHRPLLVDALSSFASGTRSYLGVSAVFGLIVAVCDTVVLWAMGVPGAFVWGVLAFVTNFIPNIGFVIGVIPPALVGLLDGGPGLMLGVIAVYCVLNLVIQSIIQPRYVGRAVGLSTSLTFLSLIFWTWVLGPLGALMAVPMSLLFKALLVEADPEARWLEPVISGRPDDHPSAAPP
jgi:AI-2 transport protein TqsA